MAIRSTLLPPGKTAPDKSDGALLIGALSCRCPRCHQGRIFSGFLEIAEICSVCGLPLARMDSGDGPAVFLIFILGFLVVPVAVWASGRLTLPLWSQGAFWGVVILALVLGMLRPAKSIVFALNYRHRADQKG